MQQQIKYDFPGRQHEERLEMSQEDHMLMESVSKSLKLVDGHYSIGLPLRNRDTEFSEFSRDYTRNLLSLWPTLKPCSIRSEYQRRTLTSCGFYGGLAEMLKRSWRSIRWSCTFGATSSPSCANFALQQCARDNVGKFNTETVTTVFRNFYVDDCLKSVECEDEALTLAKDLITLCAALSSTSGSAIAEL